MSVRIKDLEASLEPRALPRPRDNLSTGTTVLAILGAVVLTVSSFAWLPFFLVVSSLYLYGKFCLYITTQAIDGLCRAFGAKEPSYPFVLLAVLAVPSLVVVPPLVVLSSVNGIVVAYGRGGLKLVGVNRPGTLLAAAFGYLTSPLLPVAVALYVLYILCIEIIWRMLLLPLIGR